LEFRLRTARHARSAGFTLIELAVVMLLLVIVLAMVSINFSRNDEDIVREESQRLSLLMQTAQQEAMLQARVLAVAVKADGYAFQRRDDKGKFQPLERDDVLRARQLPEGVALSATIEGANADQTRILFSPAGDLTPFRVVFARGTARWRVEGDAGGAIKSVPNV
jgi:general secretion pathway protein H